jgi:hypothetical protein
MIDNYQKLEKRIAELEEGLRRVENRNPGYLTQAKAAEYLGRSKEFLRDHHVNGTGPARMPNGQYAIRDLDEWIAAQPPQVRLLQLAGAARSCIT